MAVMVRHSAALRILVRGTAARCRGRGFLQLMRRGVSGGHMAHHGKEVGQHG